MWCVLYNIIVYGFNSSEHWGSKLQCHLENDF